MALTVTDFKIDYPEFSTVDDARITRLLERAALRLNETAWGDYYDEAQGLITAYLQQRSVEATTSSGKGQGVLTSINVTDQYQESYAQTPQVSGKNVESEYTSNIYGRQFLELRDGTIIPLTIV